MIQYPKYSVHQPDDTLFYIPEMIFQSIYPKTIKTSEDYLLNFSIRNFQKHSFEPKPDNYQLNIWAQ